MSGRLSWARTHPLTLLLITSWLVLYAVEANTRGYDPIGGRGTLPPLLAWGAIEPTRVAAGEWWRLFTAAFFHFGLLHVGLNAIAMLIVGNYVEPRLGSLRMIAVYVTAIIASSLGAYATTIGQHAVTAGASGAVIGLFGAMALMAYPLIQEENALLQAIVPIMLTVFSGFTHPGISNGAHIGGLLGGTLVALLIAERWPSTWMVQARQRQDAVAQRVLSEPTPQPRRVIDPAALEGSSVTLRPRVFGRIVLVAVGLALIGSGVWALLAPLGVLGAVAGEVDLPLFVLGWAGSVLGLLLLLGVPRMALVLSPAGFRVESAWLRSTVAWADVAAIGVRRISTGYGAGQLQIVYTFIQSKAYARRGWFGSYPDARPRGLPSMYGMKAEAQAALMEEWRQRWASADLAWPEAPIRRGTPIWFLAILGTSAAIFVLVAMTASGADRRIHLTGQALVVDPTDIGANSMANDGSVGANGWGRDLLTTSGSVVVRATVWVTVFGTLSEAQTDLRNTTCDRHYKWTASGPTVTTLSTPAVGDIGKACQYVFSATDHQYAVWATDRNVRVDVLVAQRGGDDAFALTTARQIASAQIARIDRLVPR